MIVHQPKSVVKELQEGKRVIFAAGSVNSKMTLFISGPGGKSDLSSGCTVEVDENKEGIFKITNPPGKLPSGLSSADVIFVCGDSSGSKLVTMSSSSVGAFNLPDGGSVKTEITRPDKITDCYDSGSLHLPASNSLHYWTVRSNGDVTEFHFNEKDIASSQMCQAEGSLDKLCINDATITVKKDCSGSSIPSFSAGYLGSAGFLFGTDNSVYIFDAGIFSGMSSSLKKVSSKNAWKSSADVQPSSSKPGEETTNATNNSTIIYVALGILALLLIILGIIVFCCYFRGGVGGGKNSKKKEGGPKMSGKKGSSKKNSLKKSTLSKGSPSASKGKGSIAGGGSHRSFT
ncbi:hypothetical protein TYRP_006813 [Tyrophagus putrescentiae]|nr:hypothetical protein TYRP_006813 [Tyrophagus putrescentiae]